ncbi:MAG: hypothetical protein FWD48_10715 [Oscillospiraceae bacterium]|nr:hypothetical protein [Oscillospiraceae bacterium]
MNLQIKSSFKKEIMAFTRTKRFFILLCVFVGFAVFDPVMLRAMGAILVTLGEIDIMADALEQMTSSAMNGVSSLVGDLTLSGLIIYLLLINSFAGGEQKKRSIIIPRTSGLRSKAYITPKFIVYPIAAFALCLLAVLVAAAVSTAIFVEKDIIMPQILAAGALLGMNLAMFTSFHLCIGTATGKAGLSAAICIGAAIIIPGIFSVLSMGIDGNLMAYNPFGLAAMANEAVFKMPNMGEMLATILIAIGLMVACFFLALFAQNAQKIDNKGNEILI